MKEYIVYAYTNKGYQLIASTNIEGMFRCMDILINIYNRILVIEHSFDYDYEFPFFLYSGNEERYINFKKQHEKIKVKRK